MRKLVALLLLPLLATLARADQWLVNPYQVATPAITSIAYVAHVLDATTPLTAMGSIEPGDLLVFLARGENTTGGSAPAAVTPSGFTLIGDIRNSPERLAVSAYYKIAVGDEDGTSLSYMNGSNEDAILIQYRADFPIASITASTPVADAVAGNPTPQTIAASAGTPPVLGIGAFADLNVDGAISPSSTLTPDRTITDGNRWAAQDLVQNTSPSDYDIDAPDEGANTIVFGFYIHALTP